MIVSNIGKARKVRNTVGVYVVTFTPTQKFTVTVPKVYLDMGYNSTQLKNIAIECAAEMLPHIND